MEEAVDLSYDKRVNDTCHITVTRSALVQDIRVLPATVVTTESLTVGWSVAGSV